MSTVSGHPQAATAGGVALPKLHAFIDEAGQRSRSQKSSDHFVMSAVVVADGDLPQAAAFLAGLRTDLRRRPGDVLHWQNFKSHTDRLHAAKSLAAQSWATISSVVVCKRHLPAGATRLDDDQAYLYTFRFLLERLSWLARDSGSILEYTLAHVVRFKLAKLRQYESILQAQNPYECRIAWQALDPKGGRLDQPSRVEMLQCADLAASATYAAFNEDRFGNTEPRYLQELSPRLYRRGAAPLTSYGLKMHPWNNNTRAAYPWVAAL
ncbi:DUF3800 domain-containing protein [Streptomyces sp. Z423-1]|uniref:DUF3800 domain-containing protein n=1 Tax=unclassified Streptomyces TaxID=2593676 RepID=UPI001489F320|nr:DUF3800 domain-containing protein [Streptomyces sp. Z423-1]